MDMINREELQNAIDDIKEEMQLLLSGVTSLSPNVTANVDEKEAKVFADKALEAWVNTNHELVDVLNEALIELQLEDYGTTVVDKICRLSEGMQLLLISIDKNCPEPVPDDATFDQWYNYIRYDE